MSDGRPIWLQELLIDDVDWTVAYLEILIDDLPIRERCLISSSLVTAADLKAERLHLATTGDTLRRAPFRPYPTMDEQGCEVRTLDGESRGSYAPVHGSFPPEARSGSDPSAALIRVISTPSCSRTR
jgi:hypothetical protein